MDVRRPAPVLSLADVVRFRRDELPPAVREAIAALSILPDSRHKQALETLAHMAVQRSA